MLYVSCRVRYKDEYMIKELGKYVDFWRGHNLWLELVEFMRNKQVQKGLLIKKYTMLGQRNPFQRWLSLSTWKEVY